MNHYHVERGLPGGTHRAARGVTLIELMVVIVILGIIATIAVPSYRQYLLRTQRTEAKVALLQLQTAQEKFYLQNNSFTDSVGVASPTGLGLPTVTETGKYDIKVTLENDAQAYSATASPHSKGGQEDDKVCGTFTINNLGTKGIKSGTGKAQDCWR